MFNIFFDDDIVYMDLFDLIKIHYNCNISMFGNQKH